MDYSRLGYTVLEVRKTYPTAVSDQTLSSDRIARKLRVTMSATRMSVRDHSFRHDMCIGSHRDTYN